MQAQYSALNTPKMNAPSTPDAAEEACLGHSHPTGLKPAQNPSLPPPAISRPGSCAPGARPRQRPAGGGGASLQPSGHRASHPAGAQLIFLEGREEELS